MNRMCGRCWTELAKPSLSYSGPGFHSCLAPTPATHERSLLREVLFRNSGSVVEREAINDSNFQAGRLVSDDTLEHINGGEGEDDVGDPHDPCGVG